MRALLAIGILALAVEGVGCVTKSTTTEGDRQVMDQTHKGVAIASQKITEAVALVGENAQAKAKLDEAQAALAVVHENVAQQQEVHGPPAEPTKPFSAEASAEARERSKKEHESTNWGKVAIAAGGTLIGLVGAYFGMPWLSRLVPSFTNGTPVAKLAEAGVQAVTKIRQEAEANGGTIHVRDLLAIHKDEQVRAGVQELAAAAAKKVEDKFDVAHAMGLTSPEALPAAAPAPAPAPPAPVASPTS